MKLFFSVGEPSGDQHAAALIHELQQRRPDIVTSGFGGPAMQQAGCDLVYPLTDLAVMGFLRVIPMIGRFYRLVKRAEQIFQDSPPDAVILVDFPGFNWWIARKAHAAGIPVFYYLPPQLWAWASYRVKRMRRFVNHILCGLPFEKDWYAQRGIEAEYVGHPCFDELHEQTLDEDFVETYRGRRGPVVAILPGSRSQEVTLNWPLIQQVLERVQARHPDTQFLVANYKSSQRRKCEALFLAGPGRGRVEFHVGKTSEILEAADCCLMVSGSVSLEVLARKTPTVAIYRSTRLVEFFAHRLVTCDYMSLPNLFAGEELLPEFPFSGSFADKIEPISDILDDWLSHPETLETLVDQLNTLHQTVSLSGAIPRTATAILKRLPGQPVRRAA